MDNIAILSERIHFSNTRQAVRALLPQAMLNWREARYFERYGEIEMRLVDILCRRGEDAIDVGANCGGYVHFMQRNARRVVAFEPVPEFVELLRGKFGNKVIVEPIALSDRAGEAELYIPLVNGAKAAGCSSLAIAAAASYVAYATILVRTARLDDSYEGTVGFIKIDVEGHEHAVLEGAIGTLHRCRPRVLVEIEERMSSGAISRAAAFFSGLGYRGYYVHAGQLHNIETFSVSELQRRADIPDMTVSLRQRAPLHDYIYNFIFLPPGEPWSTPFLIRDRLAQLQA